jgi:hypothetical protein
MNLLALEPSLKEEHQAVLYLKGTPYEMGYQHGKLLKANVQHNIKDVVENNILVNVEHPQIKGFLTKLPEILKHIPDEYKKEMQGLADGAEVPYQKILLMNLLPEMFHCLGLTVVGQATQKGELYHVRVLDYAVGKNLQKTAAIMVVQPEGKIPFLNISYAGFIGCVTGMNRQHIALGEIGGKGYGQWDGMPMAFLLRSILENAANLQDVKKILSSASRTCEYYYVFSDGKTGDSIGVYATAKQIHWIEPGLPYAIFNSIPDEDKMILTQFTSSPYQVAFYKEERQLAGLLHQQPKDCLVLIGCTNPSRYPTLIERLLTNYGHISVVDLQNAIKPPVTAASNLHNAIFAPTTLEVWIAHARADGEPASDQPYQYFNFKDLIPSN